MVVLRRVCSDGGAVAKYIASLRLARLQKYAEANAAPAPPAMVPASALLPAASVPAVTTADSSSKPTEEASQPSADAPTTELGPDRHTQMLAQWQALREKAKRYPKRLAEVCTAPLTHMLLRLLCFCDVHITSLCVQIARLHDGPFLLSLCSTEQELTQAALAQRRAVQHAVDAGHVVLEYDSTASAPASASAAGSAAASASNLLSDGSAGAGAGAGASTTAGAGAAGSGGLLPWLTRAMNAQTGAGGGGSGSSAGLTARLTSLLNPSAPPPITAQGDLSLYSTSSLIERESHLFDPALFRISRQFWVTTRRLPPTYKTIPRTEFVHVMVLAYLHLVPNPSVQEAFKVALVRLCSVVLCCAVLLCCYVHASDGAL
jgi:hypothetical protein